MAKSKTLESAFEDLESVISQMEDKNITLDDAFKKYSEGMKLIKYCNDALDKVEKKIVILNQEDK